MKAFYNSDEFGFLGPISCIMYINSHYRSKCFLAEELLL